MPLLTTRQSRFVSEYTVHYNGARAARASGYSPNTAREQACDLLTRPHIQAALERENKATSERLQIRRDDVIRGFLSAFRAAKALGRPSDMISAMREVAKLLGYYDRPVERDVIPKGGQELLRRLEQMSEAELLALVGEEGEVAMLIDGADAT